MLKSYYSLLVAKFLTLKFKRIMAITKTYSKSKPVCKVTFALTAEAVNGAKSVNVLGDFNDWTLTPLKKQKDGLYKASLELEKGKEFAFRYMVDNNWINDEAADKYVPSGVSYDENSVVVL
jgi:1,4-alpha-glucan branching enzyme